MKNFTIKTMDELLSAVEESHAHLNNINTQTPLWWRGQADSTWHLWPRLYWDSFNATEQEMTRRFIRGAAVRHAKVPDNNDIGSWLFLMQHYRLPTRLLDWTESSLVATYFAVSDKHYNKDGVIWGLAPHELNRESGDVEDSILNAPYIRRPVSSMGMAGTTSPVWPVFDSAYSGQTHKDYQKIYAVMSNHFDVRQMVQHSVFTVHGQDEKMDESVNSNKYLVKLTIPANAKQTFRMSLERFGITESHIFPDLECLARDIERSK